MQHGQQKEGHISALSLDPPHLSHTLSSPSPHFRMGRGEKRERDGRRFFLGWGAGRMSDGFGGCSRPAGERREEETNFRVPVMRPFVPLRLLPRRRSLWHQGEQGKEGHGGQPRSGKGTRIRLFFVALPIHMCLHFVSCTYEGWLWERKSAKMAWPGWWGCVRARRWGKRQKEGKFSHSQGRGLAGRKPHIAEKCRSRRAKRAVLSSLPPSPVDISSPPPSSPPLVLRATVAKRDSLSLLLTSFGRPSPAFSSRLRARDVTICFFPPPFFHFLRSSPYPFDINCSKLLTSSFPPRQRSKSRQSVDNKHDRPRPPRLTFFCRLDQMCCNEKGGRGRGK